jgi:hypothetical protein
MKNLTALAGIVLVAGLASGCGGSGASDGGAPTDASEASFCGTFTDFASSLSNGSAEDDTATQVKNVKEAVGKLEDTGTPKGITDEGRQGFELFVGLINDLDDDVTEAQLNKIGDDMSDADTKKLEAFTTYAGTTCADAAPSSDQ